jgi:hypothetical protein
LGGLLSLIWMIIAGVGSAWGLIHRLKTKNETDRIQARHPQDCISSDAKEVGYV